MARSRTLPPVWRLLLPAMAAAWLAFAANDLFTVAWGTGEWIGAFSPLWSLAFFSGIALFLSLLAALIAALWRPEWLSLRARRLAALRQRLGSLRWPLILALAVAPVWAYHFVDPGVHWSLLMVGFFFRHTAFLLAAAITGVLITDDPKRLLDLPSGALGLVWFGFALSSAGLFTAVTNYPFSLTWSEGNRFYDYSLVFGQDLYDYPGAIKNPYGSPLRYALWGALFLWKGLPIGIHRLWDALLYTVPVATVAWLIARRVQPARLRWALVFWLALFFNQGPIYPHLLVPALAMLIWLYHPSPYVRGGSALVASVLLGLSRWTWAVGPGIWGALVDLLLYYPQRKGNLFRRLAPAALIGLAGTLPGMLPTWTVVFGSGGTGSLTASQPLLWYRLFPNPTYPPGILLATLLACSPLAVFLLWLALARRWRLDALQAVAALGASVVLLAVGMLISLKIGGGSNLHNLDLFLVTQAVLIGIALPQVSIRSPDFRQNAPRWLPLLLLLAVAIPYYSAVRAPNRLALPGRMDVAIAMQLINDQVDEAPGEVLFIDQRQLLTFGFTPAIPFVPEYEKKYMMDQAMAGNAAYFAQYYRDLAGRRFALILSEKLNVKFEDPAVDDFAEETNAWITWVAEPTLCYYEPIATFKKFNFQLLAPRADTTACARYSP